MTWIVANWQTVLLSTLSLLAQLVAAWSALGALFGGVAVLLPTTWTARSWLTAAGWDLEQLAQLTQDAADWLRSLRQP